MWVHLQVKEGWKEGFIERCEAYIDPKAVLPSIGPTNSFDFNRFFQNIRIVNVAGQLRVQNQKSYGNGGS